MESASFVWLFGELKRQFRSACKANQCWIVFEKAFSTEKNDEIHQI